ncbi:MAG: nuclear transport factor 2 family protein [Rectinemataceae bacterium]
MKADSDTVSAVKGVLRKFQEGYALRDPEKLDAFMALFLRDEDLEVIGTGASVLDRSEWCRDAATVREMVENDWRYWGDVNIDIDAANICGSGDVVWLATSGTVRQHFDTARQYGNYLEFIQSVAAQDKSPEEKVLRIQLGCANTLYELRRGEDFLWPFRFTAVLVHRDGNWLFHQMQFSFPTTRFPDERIFE